MRQYNLLHNQQNHGIQQQPQYNIYIPNQYQYQNGHYYPHQHPHQYQQQPPPIVYNSHLTPTNMQPKVERQ